MNRAQTVLIVDDEATIREVVRRYFELEGFRVLEADTGTRALDMLAEQAVDLVLMDIMLPDLDGLTLTRLLRKTAPGAPLAIATDVPIIMLTARGEELDRIVGFELGADDYVVKPFSPRELVVRAKAVLRRSTTAPDHDAQPIALDGVFIDPMRRLVRIEEKTVALTAKEFDLLWCFAQHPQQVFTREQLLDQAWGYEFYGDLSTVTVHIRRLREKIETNPAEPVRIVTVWGVGYKFEAE